MLDGEVEVGVGGAGEVGLHGEGKVMAGGCVVADPRGRDAREAELLSASRQKHV